MEVQGQGLGHPDISSSASEIEYPGLISPSPETELNKLDTLSLHMCSLVQLIQCL